MNRRSPLKTADLVYIAICAVVLAVCSWISIPTAIPFTMQTFGVFCVLLILGGKRGTIAIVVFLLLGAIGLPVFAGFTGGIGVILGTTGGYMLGFIIMGLFFWLAEAIQLKDNTRAAAAALRIAVLVIGLAACYAFGTAWFMSVYAKQTGTIGLGTALTWCVLPFILPDLIKLAVAFPISARISKAIRLK